MSEEDVSQKFNDAVTTLDDIEKYLLRDIMRINEEIAQLDKESKTLKNVLKWIKVSIGIAIIEGLTCGLWFKNIFIGLFVLIIILNVILVVIVFCMVVYYIFQGRVK
jgi:hypothetical protein